MSDTAKERKTYSSLSEGELAVRGRLTPTDGQVALLRVFCVAKDGDTAAADQIPLVAHDIGDVARRHPGLFTREVSVEPWRHETAKGQTCPAEPSPLTLNLPHRSTMSWLSMKSVLVDPAAIFLQRVRTLLPAKYGICAGMSESAWTPSPRRPRPAGVGDARHQMSSLCASCGEELTTEAPAVAVPVGVEGNIVLLATRDLHDLLTLDGTADQERLGCRLEENARPGDVLAGLPTPRPS